MLVVVVVAGGGLIRPGLLGLPCGMKFLREYYFVDCEFFVFFGEQFSAVRDD